MNTLRTLSASVFILVGAACSSVQTGTRDNVDRVVPSAIPKINEKPKATHFLGIIKARMREFGADFRNMRAITLEISHLNDIPRKDWSKEEILEYAQVLLQLNDLREEAKDKVIPAVRDELDDQLELLEKKFVTDAQENT